jgi:hypothetical protein
VTFLKTLQMPIMPMSRDPNVNMFNANRGEKGGKSGRQGS